MSGRHLYIEEHNDPHCAVNGCDCGWKGNVGLSEPCEDGVLTPGDPSPAGRCPLCHCMVYLNRPIDRVRDAMDALIWLANNPDKAGPEIVERRQKELAQALREVAPKLTLTIT